MLTATNVPISFVGGLQQKQDALQVQSPNLLQLSNGRFDKIGQINKRSGYNILPSLPTQTAVACDNFLSELNIFDNQNVYTYCPAISAWANRGTAISCVNSNLSIYRTSTSDQNNPVSATIGDITVFAWEQGSSVYYSVLDQGTQAYYVYAQKLSMTSYQPILIAFNNLIYLFFYDGENSIYFQSINPLAPSAISQTSIIVGDYTPSSYDIVVSNGTNQLFLAYLSYTNQAGLLYLSPNNNSSQTYYFSEVSTPVAISLSAQTVPTYGDVLIVSWIDGYSIYASWQNTTLSAETVTTIPIATETSQPINITTCPTSSSTVRILYSLSATNEQDWFINQSEVSIPFGYIVKTREVFNPIHQVSLAARPFSYSNQLYLATIHNSILQSTYFLHNISLPLSPIISKVYPGNAGTERTNAIIPTVFSLSSGQFIFPNQVKVQTVYQGETTFSLLGIGQTTFDFVSPNKFNTVTYSNNLLIVGGILQSYDGYSVVEQNFHLFPENINYEINVSGNLVGGNADNAYTAIYQYSFIYSWTDRFGQIQYSSPSPQALTVDLSSFSSTSGYNIQFSIPTLFLTAKSNVIIQVFRTQINSTIFYEVTSDTSPELNDQSVNYVTFTDNLSDAEIAGRTPLYTTGGVVFNSAPPSCSMISLYQDRVILAGLEDPNQLWFSKNKVLNTNYNAPEFSPLLTIEVNQQDGPVTALALMDQNLIIFKRSSIFVLSGDGPNNTGSGDTFPDPQLITHSIGCINPNSILLTTAGIIFQSPTRGIWLLDRSLDQPQYIGAGVDDIALSNTVTSATLDPNSSSAIFTTATSDAMVYDYVLQQWSTYTNHKAIDATSWNGEYVFVLNNSSVYISAEEQFYDGIVSNNQVPYSLSVTTPWMSLASVLGYQRLFRFFILGQYKGPHSLQVSIGYDFNPFFEEAVTIPVSTLQNNWGNSPSTWGGTQNFGVTGLGTLASPFSLFPITGNNQAYNDFGGAWQPYIYQVNVSRQLCTSFRVQIYDTIISPYNEAWTLNQINFEVGQMQQGVRIPSSRKFGAK